MSAAIEEGAGLGKQIFSVSLESRIDSILTLNISSGSSSSGNTPPT
ncbi:MAG: hypothetical protein JRN68_06235 [Nitrososphaerota archaeon]|nr:hypothetical protein [Nitrososphaerota archaeon]